jgi:hypothetical protein
MAALKALDPAPHVELPPDTPEVKLVAVEAGRSSDGLIATIHAGNGTVQVARLVKLADEADRHAFADAVAEATMVAPCFIRDGLLDLMAGVEGVLRQPEAAAQTHRPSQATELVGLAEHAELFHTPDDEVFATIPVGHHWETWAIRSKGFRRWLARAYYLRHDKAPGGQALQDALNVLEGQARYDGVEHRVFTRLGEYRGRVYLDLADDGWRAVEIGPTGWQVVADPPIKFRRTRGMLPLRPPEPGGTVDLLQEFVNVGGDDDWTMLVAWVTAAMRPCGPYPILVLHGEQGSAKSTTCRVLRSLIDPNKAPLRAEPREARDLIIAATNGWIIALDNLSHLSPWLSDGLCRLSTGGGFGARELFTDQEESILDAQRPCVINGIEELATRGDLLDRAIILYLPTIPRHERKSEAELWQRYDEQQPKILGALCPVVGAALQRIDRVALDELPRMADFALWATAAEEPLGWESGAFLRAYTGNRAEANHLTLEANPIVAPLQRLVEQRAWTGSATELLTALNQYVDDATRRQRPWPKTGKTLSDNFRRLAPNLRDIGIEVEFRPRQSNLRPIHIEKISPTPG